MSPSPRIWSPVVRWFKSRLRASTCATKSSLPCPARSSPSDAVRGVEGGGLRGCLCGGFTGDLHYLFALLRNEAGAQAENWGEVAFGDQAGVTDQPRKW